MATKTVDERVKEIVEEHLGVNASEITPNASLRIDLGADSLDQVELVMALEDEFHIEISDAAIERMKTVQDVLNYLHKHVPVRA